MGFLVAKGRVQRDGACLPLRAHGILKGDRNVGVLFDSGHKIEWNILPVIHLTGL